MMRIKGNVVVIVFIVMSVLLLQPVRVDAAGKRWPERLRERIKQRRLDRGNLHPGSRDETRSLAHDGLTRDYGVHLPPSYDGKTPAPVVVYLHGGGGSMTAAYKDGMNKASDKFGFVLVVPTGTGPIPDRLLTWNGGKWSRHAGEEAFESCCGYAARNNIDDVGFISKVIKEVKEKFNIDEHRIYATGISNGGLMSYRLACELSDKIAAIAPVAPPAVPAICLPQRPVPVMHIHGTADPCAPYDGGVGGGCLGSEKHQMQSAKVMVDRWKNINECSGDSALTYQKADAACVRYDQCAGGAAVEFCTVEGGGHAWPGGAQYLPVDRIGPVSYDISFDQMWEFLKKHSLPVDPASSATAGDYDFSFEHDGLVRTYKVHVPPDYDDTTPTPVVMYIHGGGGNARAAYLDGLDKAADRFGFILAAPEGTGEVKFGELRASWNGGRWGGGQCCGSADDVGFISGMIDELKKKFNVDEKRIYATGISNGGLMTNRLACELSDQITAVATVAPAAVPECSPSRPVSVMDIHGTLDPANPFDGSAPGSIFTNSPYKRMSPQETVEAWLKINGCSRDAKVVYENGGANCVSYQSCLNNTEVEFCKVEGMGHTWPGGYQYFPVAVVGPVSHDISFEQIWEFFARHPQESIPTIPDSIGRISPGDYDFSLRHNGLERTYKVHVPPDYDGNAPAPVVLNFHGGGGTSDVAQKQAGMNNKADEAGYIAVYPEGVSVTRVPGKRQHWNAGARVEYRNQQVDDVGFVSAMLDQLERDFSVDTKRVYATGLSNGAMMSYRLACELSGRIAAVAPVGGGMVLEDCHPTRPVSVMHFHGTSDPGWPYSGGNGCFTKDLFEPVEQTISQWTGLNRCSAASIVSYRKGDVSCRRHICAEDSEIMFCTVEGGGHTWPGGDASFWEQMLTWDEDCALGEGRGVGKITRDIVATDTMWEFFKKHPLP